MEFSTQVYSNASAKQYLNIVKSYSNLDSPRPKMPLLIRSGKIFLLELLTQTCKLIVEMNNNSKSEMFLGIGRMNAVDGVRFYLKPFALHGA
mmetsp:Transcript_17026/g.19691  ORF Transcript_17026/g.19691 Transcript_17026/m.19691 type:complete len:92 (+) Transcript_17026:1952-2227(+)